MTANVEYDASLKYQTRFYGARTGDVALTCCNRCGAIVWNPQMHEEKYHAEPDSNQVNNEAEQAEGDPAEAVLENPSAQGGLAEPGSAGGSDTAASGQSPRGSGAATGRATAAGSGKKGQQGR